MIGREKERVRDRRRGSEAEREGEGESWYFLISSPVSGLIIQT